MPRMGLPTSAGVYLKQVVELRPSGADSWTRVYGCEREGPHGSGYFVLVVIRLMRCKDVIHVMHM